MESSLTPHPAMSRPRVDGPPPRRRWLLGLTSTLALLCSASLLGSAAWGQTPEPLPSNDLFDDGETAGATTDATGASSATDFSVEEAVSAVLGGGADKEACSKVNRTHIIGAALVDVGALALFFVAFWFVARRGRMHPWLAFFGLLVVFAAAAAVIVGVQRGNPEVVTRCQHDVSLAKILLFDGFADWQRGLLLGAAPVLVLGPLIKVLVALIRR